MDANVSVGVFFLRANLEKNLLEQMESNICSVLSKISGISEGLSSVGSSSLISPSGKLVD
jgi:hypothetical protein